MRLAPLYSALLRSTPLYSALLRSTPLCSPLRQRLQINYNHEFAIAQFQEVLKLDDKCAMAWWGIAYGVSSNYNWPPGLGSGFDAISAAVALKEGLTDLEVDLIDALATRHSEEAKNGANPAALSMGNLPELNAAFAVAMKAVYEKVRTRTVFDFVAAFPLRAPRPAPRAPKNRMGGRIWVVGVSRPVDSVCDLLSRVKPAGPISILPARPIYSHWPNHHFSLRLGVHLQHHHYILSSAPLRTRVRRATPTSHSLRSSSSTRTTLTSKPSTPRGS